MPYRFNVLSFRPIDGDTTFVTLDLGFEITINQSCRYYGLDAPEHTTQAGKLVSQVVAKWLTENSPISITSIKRDKFADRFDGVVYSKDGITTLNSYLINNKLAKPYLGAAKTPWTPTELSAIVTIANSILNPTP